MKLTPSIKENEKALKEKLISDDIEFLEVKVGNSDGILIFARDLVDKQLMGELVLRPLSQLHGTPKKEDLDETFLSPEKKEIFTIDDCVSEVVSGNVIFLLDNVNVAFTFGMKKFQIRSITEPPTSTVIKGHCNLFILLESSICNILIIRANKLQRTMLQTRISLMHTDSFSMEVN